MLVRAHAIRDDEAVSLIQLSRLPRCFDEELPLSVDLVCRCQAVQQGANAADVGGHTALPKGTIPLIAETRNVQQELAFARSHLGEWIGVAVGEKLPFLRQGLDQRLDAGTLVSDRCR